MINWLVSDVFGLSQGRSLEAEVIIAEAQALMRGDGNCGPAEQDRIHQELKRLLPDHDPFWPRWVVERERQDGLP